MKLIRDFLQSARSELPGPALAAWASIFLTLSVLTIVLSLAASQALGTIAAIFYAVHLFRDRPVVRFPPLKIPLLLFCLLTVLAVLGAAESSVGWPAVRKLVLFLILLLACNLWVTRKHLFIIYEGLFVESALAGLVAAGQFVSRYRIVRAAHPGQIYYYMSVEQRVQGFMGHWMQFGGQQMLIFAALGAFLLLGPRRSKAWWVVIGVIGASIVLSLTRGVWLGAFTAVIYLLVCRRARWVLLALPVLLLAAEMLSPSLVRERMLNALHPRSDPALSIRFEMWQVGLRMIRKHPWLGVGPNNIVPEYPLYMPPGKAPVVGYHGHLHDNFLQLGAERGLPCLAVWIWFMAALAWQFGKMRRGASQDRWMVDAALAGWLAFVVEGCFEFNFGSSPVLMLFLFIAATPYAAARFSQPGGASRQAPGGHE